MKKFGIKSFKACGCGKKSCKICTIPDNAIKLIFHTTNKKNKKHTLKPTKKQLEIMRLYFNMLEQEENIFFMKVYELEKEMRNKVGINDLEFFRCDGEFVGVGNISKTMKLLQKEDLEK